MDFWREDGGMLAPKSDQKSMPTSKGRFCKQQWNTHESSMNFVVLGVEAGTKNRSKIDQKLKPKMNGLLASIFGGFWWVLGGKLGWKIEPRARKNRLKNASKKWWKKDAFWTPLRGVRPRAGHGSAGILGLPNYQFPKTTPHHSPQTSRTITHALREQRGGGYT